MEQLLREIIEGEKAFYENQKKPFDKQANRGIGTKMYVTKRIDLLREQLLDIKKNMSEYYYEDIK